MKPTIVLQPPGGIKHVLLHSCCAPCSSAMVEALLDNGITPTFLYFNPNIYPRDEYEIRKAENKRYATLNKLDFVDIDYDHGRWLSHTKALAHEPERGARCNLCFSFRLERVALYAHEHHFPVFTTTLATSRWKNIAAIAEAAHRAASNYPDVIYWEHAWRKHGLSERKIELIEKYQFYNQQYCGCEFSLRDSNKWRAKNNQPVVEVASHNHVAE